MSHNVLLLTEVDRLIAKHAADPQAVGQRDFAPPRSGRISGSTNLKQYVDTAIRDECRSLAETPAGQGLRYPHLVKSAMRLASLANSDWAGPFEVYRPLLEAAEANGLAAKYGEDHLRRMINWARTHASPRPAPQAGATDGGPCNLVELPTAAGMDPTSEPLGPPPPLGGPGPWYPQTASEPDDHRAHRRALVEARMAALYGTRGAFGARLQRAEDVDLGTLAGEGCLSRHGYARLEMSDGIPILLEDPRLAPDKGELFELRAQVEPRTVWDLAGEQAPRGARLVQTCGWGLDAKCVDHGVRFTTKRSCRLLDHSLCPTQATERLRVLTLPEAPEGGTYRSVWLAVPFDLPPKAGEEAVANMADTVAKAVKQVARRKVGAGLLSRSISFAMGRPQSFAHVKLVFLEQSIGDAEAAIQEVSTALGAQVLGDKSLTTPDLAVLQLMEDTMYHLAALESPDPAFYSAWFSGVRGRRLFQSYGVLYGKLREGWTKGESTIAAGETEAEVEHGLGNQVVVEAQALGFLPSGWRRKGRVDARRWEVTATVVKIESPTWRDITFSWRAGQDKTPRCDICGNELQMVLVPPSGPVVQKDGGDRWGPESG